MRITSGLAKGHTLQVPMGISDLRPSLDKVREAIFNILGEYIIDKSVLDLYAGTGALGIEALSRKAKLCDFVDRSKEAGDSILNNLKRIHFEMKSDIFIEKVEDFLSQNFHSMYDVIFLDPPYIVKPIQPFKLIPRFINEKGIVIYLHGNQSVTENQFDANWLTEEFTILEKRRYGGTNVTFLQKK